MMKILTTQISQNIKKSIQTRDAKVMCPAHLSKTLYVVKLAISIDIDIAQIMILNLVVLFSMHRLKFQSKLEETTQVLTLCLSTRRSEISF